MVYESKENISVKPVITAPFGLGLGNSWGTEEFKDVCVLMVATKHILHSSAECHVFAKKGALAMHRTCSSALPEQWPL